MPKFLSKEYGPFTGTVWLVIIVGGVGLGLVMRKFLGSREDTGGEVPASFGVETGAPAFASGGGTLFNQGQIVNDVLEAIEAQTPPPAVTDPEVVPPPIAPPVRPSPVSPSPVVTPTVDPLDTFRTVVRSAYSLEGVKPPGASTITRIALEMSRGRTVLHLRSSIRTNERRQGRNTVAESRAYWASR